MFNTGFDNDLRIPVKGATTSSWNSNSFWAYPWGRSVTHKGIDIFAKKGTGVLAARSGLVIYAGKMGRGGTVALVLSPDLRHYYYAHLNSLNCSKYRWLRKGEKLGTVGDTGNAKGKPPHLHFSITTLIPYPWLADNAVQGHKKAIYLDPNKYLQQSGHLKR